MFGELIRCGTWKFSQKPLTGIVENPSLQTECGRRLEGKVERRPVDGKHARLGGVQGQAASALWRQQALKAGAENLHISGAATGIVTEECFLDE